MANRPFDKLLLIGTAIARNGPLYCRAVVPFEAEDAWRDNEYSPWFLAHTDPARLTDDVICALYRAFDEKSDTEAFFGNLESQHGYLVLNSGPGSICWLE